MEDITVTISQAEFELLNLLRSIRDNERTRRRHTDIIVRVERDHLYLEEAAFRGKLPYKPNGILTRL